MGFEFRTKSSLTFLFNKFIFTPKVIILYGTLGSQSKIVPLTELFARHHCQVWPSL